MLTVATADAILQDVDYSVAYRDWARLYPRAGFSKRFLEWTTSAPGTVKESWGNGAAMRVSPIGWAFSTLEAVLEEAARSAQESHAHPEGIKAAKASAAAVFLARTGVGQDEIQRTLETHIGYAFDIPVDTIRDTCRWSSWSMDSVPQALTCFFESGSWEEAVRLAVSLGGDSDTQAAIAGGVAEAAFGMPAPFRDEVLSRLNAPMRQVCTDFRAKYMEGA